MTAEQKKLYSQIQAYSFALLETNLFLNSHPENQMALDYYNKTLEKQKALTKEYEQKYGPLTVMGSGDTKFSTWDWVKTPWPWQMEE